jgi:chemotaxis protein MotB
MACDNWDDLDTDMAELAGRSRRKLSIAWSPLLIVAGATFVGAFYLPMHRAHRSLTEQHDDLMKRTETVASDLERAKAERDELSKERGALASRVSEADERVAARARALEDKQERLASALAKPIKSGSVRLERTSDAVALEFSQELVFAPQKMDITPKGKDFLCDVARAAGEGVLVVTVPTGPTEPAPAALRQVLKSPWAVGAVRASHLAETLERGCRLPREQLRMVGAGAGKSGETGRVRVEVALPGA